jgi:hypothetical protein
MTYKVLRGLTFQEALDTVSHIDIEDIKDDVVAISERINPHLEKYNWNVRKMLEYVIVHKEELTRKSNEGN